VSWLARLQIRPKDARPVVSLRGAARDSCLADVAREIASIVRGISTPGHGGSTVEAAAEAAELPLPSLPPPEPRKPASLSATPPKTYRRLIGRQVEFEKAMVALRAPERRIVILTGLGGIGKTALAREIVEQSRSEGLFEYVIWSSAKTEDFIGERAQKVSTHDFTFDTLVEDISRQVGQEDILRMKPNERQAVVQALLAAKNVLIVVDNLDAVLEDEGLVNRLYSMLGKSKALCTSRHELRNELIYTIHLKGLSPEAGRDFLRDEAHSRNVEVVATASNAKLNRIHKVTGGAPLAMRLIAGQMTRQPLEEVLGALEQASFEGQNYEFYRYVYQRSWAMLDIGSKKALVSMAIFPPVTGGSVEHVREIVGMDSSDFVTAMGRLVMLSLVDKIGSAGRERFALHHLTQYFVRSDIVKKWSNQ
jgi:NB-ARC domain